MKIVQYYAGNKIQIVVIFFDQSVSERQLSEKFFDFFFFFFLIFIKKFNSEATDRML